MTHNEVVSREEWLQARKALLLKEKEHTREHDRLTAEIRGLPWVRIDKPYLFDGPNGRETLSDLFEGRSQLIVKHFMFGPGWKEGCVGCSFHCDHIDGALAHLAQRDVTWVAVSRAPFAELEPFRRRMGWRFKWVSSYGSDFNSDFHVSFSPDEIAARAIYYNYETRDLSFKSEEMSGTSVFYKDPAGDIFHTYSSYARGNEIFLGTYHYLDIVPKGRNETGPNHTLTDWVRHHDRYDSGGLVDHTGRYRAPEPSPAGSCHSVGERA
jgi:predicted dithiol-disulfide oxidoreductase (DUF899 family)